MTLASFTILWWVWCRFRCHQELHQTPLGRYSGDMSLDFGSDAGLGVSFSHAARAKWHPAVIEARLRGALFARPRHMFTPLAHHGLQRNGTNFLSLCLIELGIEPCNLGPLAPSDRRHKHTRWYNGLQVASVVKDYDAPAPTPQSIDELNYRAGFRPDTRHLVVKKTKLAALTSALNWGFRAGWFADEEEAKILLRSLSSDFDAYYEFWASLTRNEPELIKLIELESASSSKFLSNQLLELGITVEATREVFLYKRVPVSPRSRANRYVFSEIIVKNYLSSAETPGF